VVSGSPVNVTDCDSPVNWRVTARCILPRNRMYGTDCELPVKCYRYQQDVLPAQHGRGAGGALPVSRCLRLHTSTPLPVRHAGYIQCAFLQEGVSTHTPFLPVNYAMSYLIIPYHFLLHGGNCCRCWRSCAWHGTAGSSSPWVRTAASSALPVSFAISCDR
jgi:hypothetical protein